MDERTMVNDILNDVKYQLIMYENVIVQTENMDLRQILIQIRNNEESFENELIKTAKIKNYYNSSEQATSIEIQKIKKELIK